MTKIRITWDANPAAQNVTGYEVWESINGGMQAKLADVPPGPSPLFEINNPVTGRHDFQIRAVNLAGVSPMSTPPQSTGSTPTAPANVAVAVVVT